MSPMKTPPTAGMLEEAMLSLPQAARRLGVSVKELRELLGRGEILFVEVSGRLRVPALRIDAYKAAIESRKAADAQADSSAPRDRTARRAQGQKPPKRKRSSP